MGAESRFELPADVPEQFEVYVNGVPTSSLADAEPLPHPQGVRADPAVGRLAGEPDQA